MSRFQKYVQWFYSEVQLNLILTRKYQIISEKIQNHVIKALYLNTTILIVSSDKYSSYILFDMIWITKFVFIGQILYNVMFSFEIFGINTLFDLQVSILYVLRVTKNCSRMINASINQTILVQIFFICLRIFLFIRGFSKRLWLCL